MCDAHRRCTISHGPRAGIRRRAAGGAASAPTWSRGCPSTASWTAGTGNGALVRLMRKHGASRLVTALRLVLRADMRPPYTGGSLPCLHVSCVVPHTDLGCHSPDLHPLRLADMTAAAERHFVGCMQARARGASSYPRPSWSRNVRTCSRMATWRPAFSRTCRTPTTGPLPYKRGYLGHRVTRGL